MPCRRKCFDLCAQLAFIVPKYQAEIIQVMEGMITIAPKFCGDRGVLVRNFSSPHKIPITLKVLVVEDEVEVRNSLAQVILTASIPCDVHFAATGQAAIELVSEKAWDLMFIDFRLADDISGLDVLWYAKNHLPASMIYLMSAYNVEDHLPLIVRSGAEEVIKKPFDPSKIIDIINNAAR